MQVLNAGSGHYTARKLHPVFAGKQWQEVRLDIDPLAKPHVVGSISDMNEHFPANSFDAVWCSHTLEHLFAHEVPLALSEFRRVLKPDGFALVNSPDLETAATLVLERGLDYVAYQSPAGPITPLDLIFGHSPSIGRGNIFMSHKTGFTCPHLGQLMLQAGYPTVLVKRDAFDLWALALMERADQKKTQAELLAAGLDLKDRAG